MKYRLGFLAYLLAVILALMIHESASAQPVAWTQLNEQCQSEPILRVTDKTNPACKQRDTMSRSLIKQGWLPCAHGVWLSPEQQVWFGAVLNRMDAQARDNFYAVDTLVPMILTELRRKLTDAQIFAVWNEQRPAMQAYAPFGSMLMTSMMQKLAMHYARSNDPRYRLEP